MPITEKDIDQFLEDYGGIVDSFSYLLKDKERFKELSKDNDFIQENCDLYSVITHAWSEANAHPENFPDEGFSILLDHIKKFVEKWQTRPVNFWVFDDVVRPKTNEEMEEQADSLGLFDTTKVFPWTTQEEVKKKFKKIKQQRKRLVLNQDTWALNFKIKALREAGWKWREIMDFLPVGEESDEQFEARMNEREKELESQGKNPREIEKIMDKEFLFTEIDGVPTLDSMRMKKKAADDLIKKFWPY